MTAKEFFRKIAENIKPECWKIEGCECSSGELLSIFYAGSIYGRHYFCKIAYKGEYRKTSLGRKWFWSIPGHHQRANDGSLMVVEAFYGLFWFLPIKSCFVVPAWVSSIVALGGRSRHEESRSLKNDIRRIKRNGYSYHLSCDRSLLDNFYHHMYVPFVRKVHDEGAVLSDYKTLAKKFGRTCSLGLVKKDGEYVGGNLFCLGDRRRARVWHPGVKEADLEHIKKGIVQAMIYFTINVFREKGARSADLGLSRPFLNDGVLRFKKKWAPLLACRKWREKVFLIKCDTPQAGSVRFLKKNPFIFIEENRLNAAYFCDCHISEDEEKRLCSYYAFGGLSELRIYGFSGNAMTEVSRRALSLNNFKE